MLKQRTLLLALSIAFLCTPTIQAQLFQPRIDSVPIENAPRQILRPKNSTRPIDPRLLQRRPAANYLLDEEDVLGIFIEGVLGNLDESPPVQLPTGGSNLAPSIGYPVPVRNDGTLSLPLVDPISVRGLTITQAEELIAKTYKDGQDPILRSGNRIIVSLMRKRTNRVVVVRQDNPGTANARNQLQGQRSRRGVSQRSAQSGRIELLDLNEEESDVLNALTQTGGLPGVNEKQNVRVLKRQLEQPQNENFVGFPRTNSNRLRPSTNRTVNVQTRLRSGQSPTFTRGDARLVDGDIVYVDSRATEVYYTGGLLQGGEFLIPRDQDLDVVEAVSRAGLTVGSSGLRGGIRPTELIVLRRTPGIGNGQTAIRVNLNDALNDPANRMLVAPGDTLILRYRPQERIGNFATDVFRTFGTRALLGN